MRPDRRCPHWRMPRCPLVVAGAHPWWWWGCMTGPDGRAWSHSCNPRPQSWERRSVPRGTYGEKEASQVNFLSNWSINFFFSFNYVLVKKITSFPPLRAPGGTRCRSTACSSSSRSAARRCCTARTTAGGWWCPTQTDGAGARGRIPGRIASSPHPCSETSGPLSPLKNEKK